MYQRVSAWCIAALLLLGLLAGCSGDGDDGNPAGPGNGEPAEESIGPEGGMIEIPDAIALDIPAGALGDTVDFTIEENDSPEDPPGTMDFVSSAYTIEPEGQAFAVPAELTIEYEESDLHGGDENSIVIYTDGGTGWDALTTTVNTADNEVSADITHISDFAAMIDTSSSAAEGIFAMFYVHRGIMNMPFPRLLMRTDFLAAWFDSTYAPCQPVRPARADSVTCNEYGLPWDPMSNAHRYFDEWNPEFIELGADYTFVVTGNEEVPSLTQGITFPTYEPYITDPEWMSTVPLSGFTVSWESYGDGNVSIMIVGADTTQFVAVETANDGSYTFEGSELSELDPGDGVISMNHYEMEYIEAAGYDSRSYIRAMVTNAVLVTLQ